MTNIADLLVERGISRERLEECRRISTNTGESLDRVIIQKDYLSEEKVLEAYGQLLGYESRPSLDGVRVPASFVNRIPVQFTRNYNLVALDEEPDGTIHVATCSPLDPYAMDDLSSMMGREIEPVLAPRT
jgi:hypothetical protein